MILIFIRLTIAMHERNCLRQFAACGNLRAASEHEESDASDCLQFEPRIAEAFFKHLRDRYDGRLVCEPRHAAWFSHAAEDLLNENAVTRVAADPPQHPNSDEPAGFAGFKYYRLHGSPQVYYSRYSDDFLTALARKIEAISASTEAWCIFDNTAAGHAVDNAMDLWSLTGNA